MSTTPTQFNFRLLKKIIVYNILCLLMAETARAQVIVVDNLTADQLVQQLVGQGVSYSNPVLFCPDDASGSFSVVSSNLGLDSGIVLTSGLANTGFGVGVNGNSNLFADNDNFAQGDPQLDSLLNPTLTHDACVLEFDFIPTGDSLSFNYVFGSEEYLDYSCDIFNDIFAFLISGPGFASTTNIALIPGTTIPVSINSTTNLSVNIPVTPSLCTSMGPGSPFSQYYVDNSVGTTITYHGFTTVLAAKAQVTPCTTYHIKLAIADAEDLILDSGVFLQKGSFKSNSSNISYASLLSGISDLKEGCVGGTVTVQNSQTSSTAQTIYLQYAGSAIRDTDYINAPDSVIIPANDSVATFNISAVYDSIPEGTENIIITMLGNCGQIDTLLIPIQDLLPLNLLSTDTIACAGTVGTINLNATADPSYGILWTASPSSTSITNPTSPNTTSTPTVTTIYTVTASYPGCPTFTDSVGVVLGDPIVNILTPDTTICMGDSLQIIADAIPNIVSNTYSWTPTNNLTNTNTLTPTFTATSIGTIQYLLTVTSSQGCSGTDTIDVTTAPDITVTILTPDTIICEGGSIQINTSVQPANTTFTYSWTPAGGLNNAGISDPIYTAAQSNTVLTVSATSAEGCTNKDSISIQVELNPVVDMLTNDTAVCINDSIQLNAIVSPSGTYTYQWNPAQFISDVTIPDPVYSANHGDDRYAVLTATSPRGCAGRDSVLIDVKPYPIVNLVPNDTFLCMTDAVQLTAHVTPEDDYTYLWTGPDGISNTAISNPVYYTDTPGTFQFTVLVTSQVGCAGTDTSMISIHPNVVLVNVTPDQSIRYGSNIQLNAEGAVYYVWYPPATIDNPNLPNPVASPREEVVYTVEGSNEWGCRDTATVKISLDDMTEFVPTVFSPNGDGKNDVFRVVNMSYQRLQEFRVFNRYGEEVFSTTDPMSGWNGTYKGEAQDAGVYHYLIRVGDPKGTPRVYKGDVTLIR